MFEEKITPRNLRPEFKRRIFFFILMNFDLWWFLIWAYFNFSALSRDQDDRETCIKNQFKVKQGQTCRFGSIGIMIHETSSHDLSVNFNAFSFVGIRVTLVILVDEKRIPRSYSDLKGIKQANWFLTACDRLWPRWERPRTDWLITWHTFRIFWTKIKLSHQFLSDTDRKSVQVDFNDY